MSSKNLWFLGGFALLTFVISACMPIPAATMKVVDLYPGVTDTKVNEIWGRGEYRFTVSSEADGRETTILSCGPFSIIFPDGHFYTPSATSSSHFLKLPSGAECKTTHEVHLGAGEVFFPPSMNQNPPVFVTFDEENFPVGTYIIKAPATTVTWHRMRGWMVNPIDIVPLEVTVSN